MSIGVQMGALLQAPPFQVGYVVPDIGGAIAAFERDLGVAAFLRIDDAPIRDQTWLGAPMASRQNLAFGFLGTTNIELTQPVAGSNIYTDFLTERPAGGLHHLGWMVEDIAQATAVMAGAGHAACQTGSFGAATHFAYFDLRADLGHYIELVEVDPETAALLDGIRCPGTTA